MFNETSEIVVLIISILLMLVIGGILGFVFRKKSYESKLVSTKNDIKTLMDNARKEAEEIRTKATNDTNEEMRKIKEEFENEAKERRAGIVEGENRVAQRESSLEKRISNLDKREDLLTKKEIANNEKEESLKQEKSKVEVLITQQQEKLESISGLKKEQAEELVINDVKTELKQWSIQYLKDEEDKAKLQANKVAKNYIASAMQKYASEVTSDANVSVVTLPNEDMKGRIIGREGRNIRAFETLTGVDVIIDDTPEAVVLSCFNPIRRKIAHQALETLLNDGRIHPARIEEVIEKTRKEVNLKIHELGEEAAFELGITKMHPDLIKLVGTLHFRTSYGQNVLKHSMEAAFIAGKLAAELGENEILARRAGLLHDIGKAVDHEIEGSHVEIGRDLAKRFKEPDEVIDAIVSHHGDEEPKSVIAVLICAADSLSAARPGARSESLENYTKRLEQLEEITNSFEGVEKSYAIQAGREVRIMVKPDVVSDEDSYLLSKDIRKRIEDEMKYPGTIKVTVVREIRAVEVAK